MFSLIRSIEKFLEKHKILLLGLDIIFYILIFLTALGFIITGIQKIVSITKLITKKEKFSNENPDGKKILFFKMKGCGYCDKVEPNWNLLQKNFNGNGDITLEKITANDRPDLLSKYGITQFPSFIYIKNNKVLKTESGYKSYEDLKKFLLLFRPM